MEKPKSLIINTPFERPRSTGCRAQGGTLEIRPERRPASYEVFDARNNTRRTETLDLVNTHPRPGRRMARGGLARRHHRHPRACWSTGTTGSVREYPFYFCQLEAIETLIWWVEGAEEFKQGIAIPGDGGPWERLCNKMATGAGKTTVMAMIVTWQVLNALTYPEAEQGLLPRDLHRGAGPDGEGPAAGAVSRASRATTTTRSTSAPPRRCARS